MTEVVARNVLANSMVCLYELRYGDFWYFGKTPISAKITWKFQCLARLCGTAIFNNGSLLWAEPLPVGSMNVRGGDEFSSDYSKLMVGVSEAGHQYTIGGLLGCHGTSIVFVAHPPHAEPTKLSWNKMGF